MAAWKPGDAAGADMTLRMSATKGACKMLLVAHPRRYHRRWTDGWTAWDKMALKPVRPEPRDPSAGGAHIHRCAHSPHASAVPTNPEIRRFEPHAAKSSLAIATPSSEQTACLRKNANYNDGPEHRSEKDLQRICDVVSRAFGAKLREAGNLARRTENLPHSESRRSARTPCLQPTRAQAPHSPFLMTEVGRKPDIHGPASTHRYSGSARLLDIRFGDIWIYFELIWLSSDSDSAFFLHALTKLSAPTADRAVIALPFAPYFACAIKTLAYIPSALSPCTKTLRDSLPLTARQLEQDMKRNCRPAPKIPFFPDPHGEQLGSMLPSP
ncbi:hypothetical protein DFH07DRAFT_765403 [Mycena maculata]|uniref:Uncharacterized protein n=1 Tax=Mycena maculata TaxID=230809 RepID=A0AAD7K802_9AGAR|nr:hypothetical protein DFH07DRAFT_765403 [Mycena maculata]